MTSPHVFQLQYESPRMGERKCSFCNFSDKKLAYYKKDLESKIEQIVQLAEKLTLKDDYCAKLEAKVAELTHHSRDVEQANCNLITRLESTSARQIPGEPEPWVPSTSEDSSNRQGSTVVSALKESTAQEQLRILYVSIQHWVTNHGSDGTASQLHSIMANYGNCQLADSLFQQTSEY
jgi:predicted nuclease with TOPRIM domain